MGDWVRTPGDVLSGSTGHPTFRSADCPGQTRRKTGTQSQGSLVDRPATNPGAYQQPEKEKPVKANLARFTWALMLLAVMALTIGAGMRWD